MDKRHHVLFAVLATTAATLVTPWLTGSERYPVVLAAIAIPGLLALILLWRRIDRGESARVGRGFAVFLVGYCAVLAMLSGLQSLQWKERLTGYDDHLPANWLGLDRFGDWRYTLLPRPREAVDLLVVLVPAHAEDGAAWSRIELRLRFAGLIRQATRVGAKGVVLDYYFEDQTEADDMLCAAVQAAQARGVQVFVGFRHIESEGQLVRRTLPTSLLACLPESHQGYLAGYWEPDHRVRRVPLFFQRDAHWPALSLLAARHLAGGEVAVPSTGLLQYIEPVKRIATASSLLSGEDLQRYRDRLIFVGSSSEHDLIHTPFGPRQGVEIHAAATHALREGAYVHTTGTLIALPTIYALCYLLAWLQARFGGMVALIGRACLVSLAVVALAAIGALAGVWIDVAFPLLAVWMLVVIFLVLGRRIFVSAAARRASVLAQPTVEAGFDVFLCHNSIDKESVRQLFAALVANGIRPWLDEQELAPGRDWQEGIERALKQVRSVAVIVGPSGIGPWAQQEMRSALMLSVDRGLPLIPVLLPGVAHKPDLPLFLQLRTWVDLREGFSNQGMYRLIWGITGHKPGAVPGRPS